MKKFLPIVLGLCFCCAAAFSADQKAIKKDDAPAEGKTAHKGGSPSDKGATKKDDAPAPGPDAKTAKGKQKSEAPAKNAK